MTKYLISISRSREQYVISIMIALLQDIFAFIDQIIPSPINLLFPYTFTPKDLYNNDDAHNMTTTTILTAFNIPPTI